MPTRDRSLIGCGESSPVWQRQDSRVFPKKNWPMHLCGSAVIIPVAIGTAESPKSEKLRINVIDVRMSGTNNCENLWVCKER